MHSGLKKINQRQFANNTHSAVEDIVIIEEPLLISLCFFNHQLASYQTTDLTVIMRTPDNDKLLVAGFLFNEQIIKNQHDIISIIAPDEAINNNQLIVTLAKSVQPNWQKITRTFASQSSCGICGKTSLNGLAIQINNRIDDAELWLTSNNIIAIARALNSHQPLFTASGAVHGAGYISDNQWLCVYEDVGRHNAVDKVIGDIFLNNKMTPQSILVLSGRVSFELMQKAITAAIPVVIAIGAPSSLAISAAIQFNITLIGFTKNNKFNVYHGNQRINYNCHNEQNK